MAGTAQRRSRNADLGNGSLLKTAEPASSILDAHHLSAEAHGTISQLRKELVERAPGTAFPRSGESIKNTLSLICVALRVASDDVLPTGDIPPGSDTEQHLSNCLDIVQLLVENAPRALLDELEPELLGLDVPFPFYAWLTTLLVELSAKVRLNNVEGKISGLLALMTLSQHNMSRSSSLRHSLSTMLRVIVTDILKSLEATDLSEYEKASIMLPSMTGSVNEELMSKLGLPRHLFTTTILLGDPGRATQILLQLIDALIPSTAVDQGNFSIAGIIQDSATALNLFRRAWNCASCWLRQYETNRKQGVAADLIAQFLQFSQKLIKRLLTIPSIGCLDAQASKMFNESLAAVISSQIIHQGARIEQVLSNCLDNVKELETVSTTIRMDVEDILVPKLADFRTDSESFSKTSVSIQNAVNAILSAHGLDEEIDTSKLQVNEPQPRAVKRIRLSATEMSFEDNTTLFQQIIMKVSKLVEGKDSMDFHFVMKSARENHASLSEDQKREFFALIANIPCAGAGNQPITIRQNFGSFYCQTCDSERVLSDVVTPWNSTEADDLRDLYFELIPKVSRNPSLRTISLLAVRRFLHHEPETKRLSLRSSVLGEMCIHSLKASSRELRIAAGYTLPCFLRKSVDAEVRRQNFVIILECLKSVSERTDIPSQETCVLTLCRLAEVCEDEELNIILLRLLEYFGHTNPYICAVSYTELVKVAQRLSTTVAGLLRPFWGSLSITVVKNIRNRPHMAEQLCDLLGMSVDNFLRLTETHTLPYLVYTRRQEVIAKIAATHSSKSPFELCMERNNLASIIAFLLSQPAQDHDGMIYSLLVSVDSRFQSTSATMLLKTEPIPITRELLKNMGDSGGNDDSKFDDALRLLASLTPRKRGPISESSLGVGPFIEEHLFGLITEFVDTVNDLHARYPVIEKKRNIIAIGEMIKLAPNHVNAAIPQICACLRSSLEVEELRDHAFSVWCTLITHLEPEEAEMLHDQVVAIILQYWPNMQETTRQSAVDIVEHLLCDHSDQLREIFQTLPSLLSIPEMSGFKKQITDMRGDTDISERLVAFSVRCQSESAIVVEQSLKELVPFLHDNDELMHKTFLNDQYNSGLSRLTRSLLDCCVKFQSDSDMIAMLSARALGLIGCLDPNRVELTRENSDIVVLSNFARTEETFNFTMFFLQNVLVDAFLSASNTRAQSFLAYGMQALMSASQITTEITAPSNDIEKDERHQRWISLPEIVRNTVTPFLTSRYAITLGATKNECGYPLFSPNMSYGEWLCKFVIDLLHKGYSLNVQVIFSVCARIIRGQDIRIPSFILPFAVLNVAADGPEDHRQEVREELIRVLSHPSPENSTRMRENILLCSESVFNVLDYLSRWLQGKKKQHAMLASHPSASRPQTEMMLELSSNQIKNVEQILSSIPPEVISRRAVECKSFSRALFHWEQYIRQRKSTMEKKKKAQLEPLYQRLQYIYTQIDEPDGIEGISSHLHVFNIDQQVLEHRTGGRWAAAQSWYELQLDEEPDNSDAQLKLLTCLKESGQQDALLDKFETFRRSETFSLRFLPFAVEASLLTAKWARLDEYLKLCLKENAGDFTIGVASALNALRNGDKSTFHDTVKGLRLSRAKSMTSNSTLSLQSCHDELLQLHALSEIEAIVGADGQTPSAKAKLMDALDHRLDLLGVYISEKQYILGLRRAAMALSNAFSELDLATVWLTSARLFRKNGNIGPAYNSVMHAAQLKAKSATIEHSRLLWKDGHHRKAIQTLKGAIAANAFVSHDYELTASESIPMTGGVGAQNIFAAKAHLLLAKWTDRAGQTHSEVIIQRYREAIKLHTRWEKAHYYLGRHYNKIIESERAKPPGKEAQIYLSGEASKLAIDSYLRSLQNGNKFVFQTLPKVLTLWLEHASNIDQPFDSRRGSNSDFQKQIFAQRKKTLDGMHSQLKKYLNQIPAEVLFTVLAQVVARISHSNHMVSELLTSVVVKTLTHFPRQGLWSVLALVKSSSKERASKGITCLNKIIESNKKLSRSDVSPSEIRAMITQGQKFSEELLELCFAPVKDKVSRISLARDLNFNHKVAPCRLVVPFQIMLTPILPPSHEKSFLEHFRPFPGDVVSIERVMDEALVLSSLQKPRKISIQGTDGKVYSLLCKPKDDLRKDQRLMEFNNMINGFLKRNVEAIKRRMYIKTYAVTPLSEECGIIEWVDNLRTLREIVTKLLRERGITPNYIEIRRYLDEACSEDDKLPLFTTHVLAKFPPVLHEWFIEMFPDPDVWMAARMRYTRTSAVMSIVGHVLGLGDRHGENILFEESTGGILHVDFNCLFDKGLTFDKPEVVPFRLTHNMVDAFGAYSYNGPFRRTCEITLSQLRQNQDALMTSLETFLYDPTTDFIGKKRRTHKDVPHTPEGVLDCIRNKLRGLLPRQPVPLSVDGQVDELIMQATDKKNLASMYIGWCAFF